MKQIDELYKIIISALKSNDEKFLKGIHTKAIASFLAEVEKIIKDNDATNDLKKTRLSILLEGFVSYLVQFGFGKEIVNRVIKMRADYWFDYHKLPPSSLSNLHQKNIEQTALYFAFQDGLLTTDLMKSKNLNFDSLRPWEVNKVCEMKDEVSTVVVASPVQKYEQDTCMPALIESGHFSAALNGTGGYILSKLDKYSEAFVRHAVSCNGRVMNIGSGFGIPERLALLLGAKEVVCNDVSTEQLELIEKLTPASQKSRLELVPGSFPDGVNIDKLKGSIRVLGMFRVIHFAQPPHDFRKIIKMAHELLDPEGVLILSAETPYLGNWKKFIPEYEANKKAGHEWPGYIPDTLKFESDGYSRRLPKTMHFLDVDVITRELTRNNLFKVEACATFSRAGTFPQEILYNGNESVGAIARKSIRAAL